jgi:hexulose-6-phosphate isomerase
MKKAMNHGSLPGYDFKKFFKLAKEAGFEGAELNFRDEGDFSPDTAQKRLQEIAKDAKDAGIKICSICLGILWKYPLTDPNPETRRKGAAITERAMEAASILGADTILVVPGLVTEEVFYTDAYGISGDAIAKLGEKAKKLGLYIGLENGGMKMLSSPIEFRGFIDDFHNDRIKFFLDTANTLIEGFPEHWIKIMGDRIVKVHFKDFKRRVRVFPEAYAQLLHGDVNWKAVIAELRNIGYKDYVIGEIPAYRFFPEKILKDTSENMDLILGM